MFRGPVAFSWQGWNWTGNRADANVTGNTADDKTSATETDQAQSPHLTETDAASPTSNLQPVKK
jgi:hypothetical protein